MPPIHTNIPRRKPIRTHTQTETSADRHSHMRHHLGDMRPLRERLGDRDDVGDGVAPSGDRAPPIGDDSSHLCQRSNTQGLKRSTIHTTEQEVRRSADACSPHPYSIVVTAQAEDTWKAPCCWR